MAKKHPSLERAGVSGFNKPKRTPNHPTKKFVVVAKQGDKIKTIRFGDAKMKIKRISQIAENPFVRAISAIQILQVN